MRFIKVRIMEGTADIPPPSAYPTWLAFWEKKKNKKAKECESFFCTNKAELGVHVVKSGQNNKVYILPMCKICSSQPPTLEFEVWETDLVPTKTLSIQY